MPESQSSSGETKKKPAMAGSNDVVAIAASADLPTNQRWICRAYTAKGYFNEPCYGSNHHLNNVCSTCGASRPTNS